MIKKISLYYHTLKYLRPIQIFYRVIYSFYNPVVKNTQRFDINLNKNIWVSPIFKSESIFCKNEFIFLNKRKEIDFKIDSEQIHFDELWTYNLHYFDGILAKNNNFDRDNALIHSWIKSNTNQKTIGWDPYPISLRVVNWIKWMIQNNNEDSTISRSLFIQGLKLEKTIEYDLSANHLLANAKALIFLGLYFSGNQANKWLKMGQSIYMKEINEQVLNDGGHYERSPMYHAIILEDLLDIINASNYWVGKLKKSFLEVISSKAISMIEWLSLMVHPDGEVSYFNDSVRLGSSSSEEIKNYAARLDLSSKNKSGINYLEDSGYISVIEKDIKLIMDIGEIGPTHQPGHAHAESLSFELSLFNQRFLVNSGISSYQESERRSFERSTAAHNTIEIDGLNSSEVWKSFRVGRRAESKIISISDTSDLTIEVQHNGYSGLKNTIIHQREWRLNNQTLQIKDTLEGKFREAISRLYLHPSIEFDGDRLFTFPNGEVCEFNTSLNRFEIKDTYWSEGFGKLKRNQCIELNIGSAENIIEFRWKT